MQISMKSMKRFPVATPAYLRRMLANVRRERINEIHSTPEITEARADKRRVQAAARVDGWLRRDA